MAITLLALLAVLPGESRAWRLSSYAFVNDDGSLRIRGHRIRLFGVYIPPTERICRPEIRPVPCAPRAALALSLRIGSHFVACEPLAELPDGSLAAVCRVQGEDLAAWMLSQGWALALPEAPFEYAALERIARHRGFGVWGIPVDRLERFPPLP